EIEPNAVLFLMNALYFKGDWSTRFDPDKTASEAFTLVNGSAVQVPTMRGSVGAITHFTDTYRVVELPYGRKNFSMVIVVPNNLSTFIEGLDAAGWNSLMEPLNAFDGEDWP
ncbi:serpin family protein, partial [Arthrospira platensis SPKY1]|nr:serpin family protein [Arthrospira platensis SPKY1]